MLGLDPQVESRRVASDGAHASVPRCGRTQESEDEMDEAEAPTTAAALARAEAAPWIRRPGAERHRAQAGGRADHRGSAALAKRRTLRAAFDYADGAAEGEMSLARGRGRRSRTSSSTRRSCATCPTSTRASRCSGVGSALPFGIAPTGFTRLMRTEGERAGAAAAGAAGIPFSLSTLGTASVEEVAAANPGGRNWFQLYMWKDRDRSLELVQRAAGAGFDTLLVTVDVPVAGARLRDRRNGMTIPPKLKLTHRARRVSPAGMVVRLRHDRAARVRVVRPVGGDRRRAARHDVRPDAHRRGPRLDQEDRWPGKLVVKGDPDARRRPANRVARRRRHHAVESRWQAARPRADPVPPAARRRPRGRAGRRGPSRHRDHERRRHRRLRRSRRAFHARRSCVPLRPDGRRPRRGRPRDRHPRRGDHEDDEAPGRPLRWTSSSPRTSRSSSGSCRARASRRPPEPLSLARTRSRPSRPRAPQPRCSA